jgi:hypothetical protein
VGELDQHFGRLHLLIDRLFENQASLTSNSYMFHARFSLILSAIVQMKNSLVKCLEHEAKEKEPDLKIWT